MEQAAFERAWPSIRDRVKARWPKLTDEDLKTVGGNPALLTSLVQEKYDLSRQLVEVELRLMLERAGVP